MTSLNPSRTLRHFPAILVALLALLSTRSVIGQGVPPVPAPTAPAPTVAPTGTPTGAPTVRTPAAPTPTGAPTVRTPVRLPTRVPVRPGMPAAGAPTATGPGGASPVAVADESPNSLNYQEAATDLVLMDYAKRTKRTLLMTPNVPKPPITLRSDPNAQLTDKEYLAAIEQILNLNKIALVPIGEKFLRVILSDELSKYAPETRFPPVEGDPATDRFPEDGQFVSRVIELRHIELEDAKPVIDGFIRTGAQVQMFPLTKSLLVTDSSDNINRILEIIGYIDRPIIVREVPNIIQIRFAKAADIKERLREIVDESQDEAAKKKTAPVERQAGSPGTVTRPLPAGVTLPRSAARPAGAATGGETGDTAAQEAERGMFRGTVKIIADERTNILIILTHPDNMERLNQFVAALDVETAPEVTPKTFRLEHALAKDVATLLNDLIGGEKKEEPPVRPGAAAAETGKNEAERSQNLAEFVQRRQASAPTAVDAATKTKFGQLDAKNIKILADERTNSLIVMASLGDMVEIEKLIKQVDIMLSQVVIETVLIELNFEDSLETGIDWVQRAMKTVDSAGNPVVAFAGRGGGGILTPTDPMGMTTASAMPGLDEKGVPNPGITYFATFFGINLDVVMRAAKTDSRARIMSSPVIMTQDNKEAVLEATVKRYFFKGKKYAGTQSNGSTAYEDDVEQQDVGLTLKVTPRINPTGYVVLTIEQKVDNVSGTQKVNNDEWPIVSSRRMGSDIAVNSGETVVLGGLAQNSITDTQSKIPILGDIPFLGWFFRTTRKTNSRNEIVVFLTPRVITGPVDSADEARNRKAYLDTTGVWRSDWSGSDLADPISEKDRQATVERGSKTVRPPKYPLTRELAPLNERYGLNPAATNQPTATATGFEPQPGAVPVIEPEVVPAPVVAPEVVPVPITVP